jgi:uncharacterized protein (UPF0335 family)
MNDKGTLLVDNFLSSKKEYVQLKTDELIKALIALELQKKEIDYDIKMLKLEARDDGVDVNLVSKVFNKLKTRLRAKQEMLDLEDALEEELLHNSDLISEIKFLIAPIVVDEE